MIIFLIYLFSKFKTEKEENLNFKSVNYGFYCLVYQQHKYK